MSLAALLEGLSLAERIGLDPALLPTAPPDPVLRMGQGEVRYLGSPGSFAAVCCEREIMRVEGAAESFFSYHLRHAWGGLHLHCPTCSTVYSLAGDLTTGGGLPSLVDPARVDWSRCERLSEVETLLLDVALERDDALWERSAESIRRARAAGSDDEANALHVEALLLRAGLARRKLHEVKALARARGLSEWPEGARLFRMPDGGGAVVDYGPTYGGANHDGRDDRGDRGAQALPIRDYLGEPARALPTGADSDPAAPGRD